MLIIGGAGRKLEGKFPKNGRTNAEFFFEFRVFLLDRREFVP
jgi:hypothetical protein